MTAPVSETDGEKRSAWSEVSCQTVHLTNEREQLWGGGGGARARGRWMRSCAATNFSAALDPNVPGRREAAIK